MHNPHILHEFDHAINNLRAEVLAMSGKARHNLERAVRSLFDRNTELANAVIADDDEVDAHERHIDQAGIEMLTRFHPLASDLRLVVSSMKISGNLERISDHATSIARRARKTSSSPELRDTIMIEPLYTLADQLLRDAVTAYQDHNPQLGASLHLRDKELDKLEKKISTHFGNRIEQDVGRSQDFVHLIFVARSLERVGDLAVNIGEDAVFADAARDLRHESNREVS
jgi:phosphate transport system protein